MLKKLERAVFGNVGLPLAYSLVGRSSLKLLQQLRSNQRLTKDEISRIQWGKLHRLLVHAYENVPFYRQRFDAVGAKPDDIRNLDDYTGLPVLTKQDLRLHLDEIVARNFGNRLISRQSTGGSSGNPTDYYHDNRYMYEIASGAMWRAWEWAGIYPGDRHLYVWGGPREIEKAQSFSWRLRHWLLRRIFADAFDLGENRLRSITEKVLREKPVFVYGYTSSIALLAKYLLNKDIYPNGIKAAMTTAETLLPEQRSIIREAFGCPVYDQYACREVRSVASECSHGKLHINTDLNVVEFIPLPGSKRQVNQIVLTPLELFGFPLLRYVNGDCGVADEPCDCPLPFPTMRIQSGRLSDNFVLPSGRIVHGEYFTHLVYGTEGITQFQFHQVSVNRIMFRFVRDPNFDTLSIERQLRTIKTEAQNALGGNAQLEVEEVAKIPPVASGKFRFTLSDVTEQMVTSKLTLSKDK